MGLAFSRLPQGTLVCYKPFMRKWMRERLKRRKRKSEEQAQSTETAQAPLQPLYYEAQEPGPAAPAEEVEHPEPAAPAGPEPRAEAQPGSVGNNQLAVAPSGSPDKSRRRRRRGRGGRGRGPAQPPATPLQPTLVRQPEAQAAQPVAAAETPQPPGPPPIAHKLKGVVVLAIGLPGSGKSSWFKRHNITPLSSDMLRSLLFDDPTEQRFQDLVFSNLRSMLKARLIARRPMNYVDATNLSPHERHTWIKMARDYGYEVHAVFFDVPLEVCMERNKRRQRVVTEDIMRRMSSKLRPPTFEEGFAKITVVRVKKQGE